MTPQRILVVCHNHPMLHPGGTEILAHELFRELAGRDGIEALFLACASRLHREQKPGTAFQTIGRSADELVLWTGHFDRFNLSQIDLHGVMPELAELLRCFKPDVVHFHHVLMIGAEALLLVRRLLPQARIVLTLHDYFPICAHEGQMVKTGNSELCHRAAPDACHGCFPQVPHDRFVLRANHLQTLFSVVDRFIAPSEFLKRRYVEWGIAAERIAVLPNARPRRRQAPPRPLAPQARRDRFGYFGNVSPFKGTLVLLQAARLLLEDDAEPPPAVEIHGGMPFQSEEFKQRFAAALAEAQPVALSRGAYASEEVAALIGAVDTVVVPSIWWENAPLVILEAFQQRRPVICSGIGGMAELVRDGVNGLHVPPNDPVALAAAMRRTMQPAFWQRLCEGIPEVADTAALADRHLELYAALGRRSARRRSA